MMVHVACQNIVHRYGDTPVLSGIDLKVDEGAFVSLLGPSGCGKTTMLRIIAGFVEPTEGRVVIAGRDITGTQPHKRNIGVVFQSYALFPHLTAAGNVAFGLKMRDVGRAERDRRVAAALELVGLTPFAERYPAQLSGGQQQRVALARALVIEPDVLLLDEPLSNLDARLRAEMRDEIARLRESVNVTTIFVTHDQAEALAMSDRIALMDRGRIVESAAPQELAERPRTSFAARFLGGRTVLGGRLERSAEGPRFVVADGPTIGLPAASLPAASLPAASQSGANPLDATHIVLRASRLTVADGRSAPDDAALLEGSIVRNVYLGDHQQLTVDIGGPHLTVYAPTGGPTLDAGAPARIAAGPDAIAFLHEPTEAGA